MIEQINAFDPEDDPLLQLAEMAEAANLPFTDTNVGERSRDILNSEYADYLLKRMLDNDTRAE